MLITGGHGADSASHVTIAAPAAGASPAPAVHESLAVPKDAPAVVLGLTMFGEPWTSSDGCTIAAPAPTGTPSVISIHEVQDRVVGLARRDATAPLVKAAPAQPPGGQPPGGGPAAGQQTGTGTGTGTGP